MEHFNDIVEILFRTSCENSETKPHSDGIFILYEIGEYLRDFGVEIEIQEYEQKHKNISYKHANLIVKNRVNTSAYIALQGHIDTVPCNEPYRCSITSSEIIGRGAVDMKGPLVGIICSFIDIVLLSKQNVVLIITDDEETDFAGIKKLIEKRAKYLPPIEFCINAEPTNLRPTFLTKGFAQYEISSKGYTAHSSSDKNDFLIERMSQITNQVCIFLEQTRNISDSIYGETRSALTMINSGTKTNQLPDEFYLACNIRLVKKDLTIYKNLFDTIVRPFCSDSVEIKEIYFEPFESLLSEETVQKLRKSFTFFDYSYEESVMQAFTESYMFNNVGIPCFSWGPGSMDLAHVVPSDEKINIEDIKLYSRLLTNFIANISNSYE